MPLQYFIEVSLHGITFCSAKWRYRSKAFSGTQYWLQQNILFP